MTGRDDIARFWAEQFAPEDCWNVSQRNGAR
jgi:hypothetical protein